MCEALGPGLLGVAMFVKLDIDEEVLLQFCRVLPFGIVVKQL